MCFAYVTDRTASIDQDVETGEHHGAADALALITATLDALVAGCR